MKKINYKTIIDAIQDGIFVVVDKKIVFVNDSFCKIIGYKKEEILNKSYIEFCHKDDINFLSDIYKKHISEEVLSNECEIRFKHKNKKTIYAIISVTKAKYDGNIALIGIIKDITNRIELELKIQGNEKKYKSLMDLSPDPIVVTDLEGYIIIHNQAAYNIYQSTDTNFKLIGKRITDFISNEDESNKIMNIIYNKKSSNFVKYEINFKNEKGKIIPFELNTSTIYDSIGNPKYKIITGRDISNIKIYENKLKSLIDEKETMIKEIHHRIKNSLQQIHSLLGIQSEHALLKYNMSDNMTDENTFCREQLQKIISDARQRISAISIIHQMFYKTNTSKVNFKDFLKQLIKNLEVTYSGLYNEIKINIFGDDLGLCLEHIIPCGLIANEIISNSFKHAFVGRDSGNINIELKNEKCKNIIKISDDGIGINDNIINLNKGLGISLIYGLTEQIGGKINLNYDSTGTRYEIEFNKKYLQEKNECKK